MIELSTIEQLVIAYLPVIATFIGNVFECVKILKIIKNYSCSHEQIQIQMKAMMQENCKLKKQLNELLTKIDKIERK